MGQGFSSGNNLHFQLDRSWYYAGEVVTGKLYVNVVTAVAIDALYVKAVGKEYTMHYVRHHSHKRHGNRNHSHSHNNYRKHDRKNKIFEIKVPLLGKGELAPGNYEFPLSFQLPSVLPGSFEYRGTYNDREATASISYEIKAILDVKGIFSSDPKAHAHFHILQKPSGAAPMPLHDQQELTISSCCSSKGSILLSADAGTNVLHAGDTLGVTAQVDNRSSVHVTSVNLQLEQCVSITSDIVLSTTLGQKSFGGVPKGTSRTGKDALQAMLPLPHGLPPTSAGQITRMWYQVKLHAATEGCCSGDAQLKAPVAVEVPQAAVPQAPVLERPAGWHPMVYPQFQFSFKQDAAPAPLAFNEYTLS